MGNTTQLAIADAKIHSAESVEILRQLQALSERMDQLHANQPIHSAQEIATGASGSASRGGPAVSASPSPAGPSAPRGDDPPF
jgi:hypothetical protein